MCVSSREPQAESNNDARCVSVCVWGRGGRSILTHLSSRPSFSSISTMHMARPWATAVRPTEGSAITNLQHNIVQTDT